MSVILSTTVDHHNGQSLEIFVKYCSTSNVVLEIKSVFLNTHGMKLPVGDMFINVPELDVAINKIIDRVDWLEIYLHTKDCIAA
jgi:hypothetical protein